jgi:hypothetical protein
MKTIARTLLILLVAAAVIGATVALVQVPALQTLIVSVESGKPGAPPVAGLTSEGESISEADRKAGIAAEEAAEEAAEGTGGVLAAPSPDFAEGAPGGHHGAAGGSLLGAVEVLKDLAIVLVVTTIVALPSWLVQRRRRVRRATTASRAAA